MHFNSKDGAIDSYVLKQGKYDLVGNFNSKDGAIDSQNYWNYQKALYISIPKMVRLIAFDCSR
mgnify:CR=1 FL=1